MTAIETERLILRTWQDTDAEAYFHINQDPHVLEYLLGPLTRQQVADFMRYMNSQYDDIGLALWAVEEKATGLLMGYIGFDPIKWEAPFGQTNEIAWRLGSQFWGKGYATEGAKAVLEYGFNTLDLKEVVSFTVPANVRSVRVMEKIGMHRDFSADFAHPKLPADHPLSLHVLYRICNTK